MEKRHNCIIELCNFSKSELRKYALPILLYNLKCDYTHLAIKSNATDMSGRPLSDSYSLWVASHKDLSDFWDLFDKLNPKENDELSIDSDSINKFTIDLNNSAARNYWNSLYDSFLIDSHLLTKK